MLTPVELHKIPNCVDFELLRFWTLAQFLYQHGQTRIMCCRINVREFGQNKRREFEEYNVVNSKNKLACVVIFCAPVLYSDIW